MTGKTGRALTAQEIKQCQLDVLEEIHAFCLKNGLKYYMVYGTLIGAVRHQGYIPWDDDIDIAMPREDYDCFIKTFNGSKPEVSKCIHFSIEPGYYLDFAKVYDKRTRLIELVNKPVEIGAYIDVFPIDVMPDDTAQAEAHLRKILEQEKLLRKHNQTGSGKGRALKSLVHDLERLPLKGNRLQCIRKIEELGTAFRGQKTGHVSIAVGGFALLKDYVPAEWYAEPVLVPFEGTQFCAPAKAHELLTHWYGDYMTLPPEQEQQSHHIYNAFWK